MRCQQKIGEAADRKPGDHYCRCEQAAEFRWLDGTNLCREHMTERLVRMHLSRGELKILEKTA